VDSPPLPQYPCTLSPCPPHGPPVSLSPALREDEEGQEALAKLAKRGSAGKAALVAGVASAGGRHADKPAPKACAGSTPAPLRGVSARRRLPASLTEAPAEAEEEDAPTCTAAAAAHSAEGKPKLRALLEPADEEVGVNCSQQHASAPSARSPHLDAPAGRERARLLHVSAHLPASIGVFGD